MTGSIDSTELVELSIDRYKNLSRIRLPWSRHVVIFGANGVGKTNVLEALALAFGSRATTWQLAARASNPAPGAIGTLLRTSDRALPLAPDGVMAAEFDHGAGRFATMMQDCKKFWSLLGIERGDSWTSAMSSGALDGRLADLLSETADRPLVRYDLERITGLAEARGLSRGEWLKGRLDVDPTELAFQRRYSRTLSLDGPPPGWLVDLASGLPTPFSPFRRWLDEAPGVRSPFCDLLELPPTDFAPVRIVWLSAERSGDEAWFDLWEAFESARGPARELRSDLSRLLFRDDQVADDEDARVESDADWWLTWHAARIASSVLSRSMPHLTVQPEDARVLLLESSGDGLSRTLSSGDGFHGLSSGERAWVDVALAWAAAGLDQLADEMDWVNAGFAFVSDEELLEAATELESILGVFQEEYWSAEDVDGAFLRIMRLLGNADDVVLRWVEGFSGSRRRLMEEAMVNPQGGFRSALMRRLTMEMYDEPERHLHPRAQRLVASGLAGGLDDADVTISSHSHLFLGASGATHFHLSQTSEGPVAAVFDPARLDIAAAVTQELGLTRGELLTLTDYVLIVEGRVDRLVLTSFYGSMLDAAGIRILTLSGVDEAASLAELELIGSAADVPVGVLFDHVRVDRLSASPGDSTKEERALRELRRELRRRRKDFDFFGLKREDIVAYLDETAIATVAPSFPGWRQLEGHRRRDEKFKSAIERGLSVANITVNFVKEVIDEMQLRGRLPSSELPDVVATVIASATAAR